MSKGLLVLVCSLALASTAMAAGSPSPSRPPAPRQPSPSAWDLGVKAVQAGDYARAVTLFQRVVQAEPRNADAWNYLGFSHRHLRQFDQSLAAYQQALAINPNHLGAHEYLGELYLQTGAPDKAREHLARLGALCPAGCKEVDDLRKAIQAYESARK
jgi:Flp pilus assembly protein TadD